MMMIADISACRKPFSDIASGLERIGVELGVQVKCQREEIFEKMHRI